MSGVDKIGIKATPEVCSYFSHLKRSPERVPSIASVYTFMSDDHMPGFGEVLSSPSKRGSSSKDNEKALDVLQRPEGMKEGPSRNRNANRLKNLTSGLKPRDTLSQPKQLCRLETDHNLHGVDILHGQELHAPKRRRIGGSDRNPEVVSLDNDEKRSSTPALSTARKRARKDSSSKGFGGTQEFHAVEEMVDVRNSTGAKPTHMVDFSSLLTKAPRQNGSISPKPTHNPHRGSSVEQPATKQQNGIVREGEDPASSADELSGSATVPSAKDCVYRSLFFHQPKKISTKQKRKPRTSSVKYALESFWWWQMCDETGGATDSLYLTFEDEDKIRVFNPGAEFKSELTRLGDIQKVVVYKGDPAVKLSFQLNGRRMWGLKFCSPDDCAALCGKLKFAREGLQMIDRPPEFDSSFERRLRVARSKANQLSEENLGSTKANDEEGIFPRTAKRRKLRDSLQDDGKQNAEHHNEQSPYFLATDSKPSRSTEPSNHSPCPKSPQAEEIPVKKSFLAGWGRETRSRTQARRKSDRFADLESSPVIAEAPNWEQPLVYPPTGRKRAEVEAQDLERLREHQFMNDNLIGLYMRFIEHHIERNRPDLAERVYFFNSYFFASLTNSKGKGINYSGVRNWTRKVDLFKYDYIVVPVNESAHWYMIVICNLPALFTRDKSLEHELNTETKKEISEYFGKSKPKDLVSKNVESKEAEPTGESEAKADEQNPEASWTSSFMQQLVDTASQNYNSSDPDKREEPIRAKDEAPEFSKDIPLHTCFRSLSLSAETADSTKPTDNEDWPADDEHQAPASNPFKHLRRSDTERQASGSEPKTKKDKRKLHLSSANVDTSQPCLISFDSLNYNRTPTFRALREYLEEEARDKQNLEIQLTNRNVKGKKASCIPYQDGFSDCGIFLLVYLEKFIQDPKLFISSVLKDQLTDNDWPYLESKSLRRRFRDFLFRLHDEQETVRVGKEPQNPLLVDQLPLHIFLPKGYSIMPPPTGSTPEESRPDSNAEMRGVPKCGEKLQSNDNAQVLTMGPKEEPKRNDVDVTSLSTLRKRQQAEAQMVKKRPQHTTPSNNSDDLRVVMTPVPSRSLQVPKDKDDIYEIAETPPPPSPLLSSSANLPRQGRTSDVIDQSGSTERGQDGQWKRVVDVIEDPDDSG